MAGGNTKLRDSANDRTGYRMSVHKDHRSGETSVPYTSGHVFHWQKTEVGDGTRLKEVRTLIKVDSPHEVWIISPESDTYGDRYDRAFQKGKYAAKEEGATSDD